MDMQVGHEDWVKEIPNSKRPQYQGPSMSVALGSTRNKRFGFNTTLQRGRGARGRGTSLRIRDTFSKAQATSVSHPRISETPWCQKCRTNHFENCLQDRACYNCGGVGHLKKNCPTRCGSQGQSRRSGRPATRRTLLEDQPVILCRPVILHDLLQLSYLSNNHGCKEELLH